MRNRGLGFTLAIAVLLSTVLLPKAAAHPTQFTTLEVRIKANGDFRATLNIDILSFALEKTSAATSNTELEAALDEPRATLGDRLADSGVRFRRELVIRTDAGGATISSWTLPGLPDVEAVLARNIQPRILVPGEIDFSGRLPARTHTIAIRLPYVLGDTVQVLVLPGGDTHAEQVTAGSYSSTVEVPLKPPGMMDRLAAVGGYVAAGFRSFVYGGLDYVLFVLALFLFGARPSPLLGQVLAFTIAHSLTLWLASYGVVRLPASVTGPLMAASIVFVAADNIFSSDLKPWRLVLVFCFGLVHGLGLAGALSAAQMPPEDFPVGLIGFNLGVECGQLAVILGAFLAVGWFRHRPWYRRFLVIPASGLMACLALFWTLEGIFWPAHHA